jgi:hypothetical protein
VPKVVTLIAFVVAICTAAAHAQVPPPSPPPGVTASPQPGESPNTLTIPRGVIVPILVTRDVRVGANGTVQEEHKVKFAVDQVVVVDGYVIAKPGDLAEGHYDTSTNQTKRQFETETSQELELDIDDIVNFCGDTIYVQFERTFVGGTRSGFLSFGVHEHDAVFAKGAVLEASTDRVQKQICVEPATAPPPPLPKNIVTPDSQVTPPPR